MEELGSYQNAELSVAISLFQNEIHQKQRDISFGYDGLLYFSAILIMLALADIIKNRFSQQAEFETLKAVHKEQKIFSRNLHDGLAQDLAAIKIYNKKGDSGKISFYTDRALNEVRYLIDSSRISPADGLEPVIREMLTAFEANHDIKTSIMATSNFLPKLRNEYQTELFHIIQEALSNIARHANATEVKVMITDVGDTMRIVVSDNGMGFSEECLEAQNSDGKRKHWGINNIRERVESMHGTVEFIHEGGTSVAIKIKNPLS